MREKTKRVCDGLLEDREIFKEVFKFEYGILYILAAGITSRSRISLTVDRLRDCKDMLKDRCGTFSSFRGNMTMVVTAYMAAADEPELFLEDMLSIYNRLKEHFHWSSTYLAIAASIIAQLGDAAYYDKIIADTDLIYQEMKKNHPFLTSGEDIALCALLSMSGKRYDDLFRDMEECYDGLKGFVRSGNSRQSLSHVLSLYPQPPRSKCENVIRLYKELKEAGCRYGKGYELASLGVLAMSDWDYHNLVLEMMELHDYLKKQRGFSSMSLSKPQRLMFAGFMLMDSYSYEDMGSAVLNSTVAAIIAQQVAMMCVMVSVSASSASS